MISTAGSKKPGPFVCAPPSLTIRTPKRKRAVAAKEFPSVLRIDDITTGSPFLKTTLPNTPSSVINRIGFRNIDFKV